MDGPMNNNNNVFGDNNGPGNNPGYYRTDPGRQSGTGGYRGGQNGAGPDPYKELYNNSYIPSNQQAALKKKSRNSLILGIVIFLVILGVIVAAAAAIGHFFGGSKTAKDGQTLIGTGDSLRFGGSYIAELHVEGEISDGDNFSSSTAYSHEWMLDTIEKLKNDSNNKGIILFVDTPGGSVYATDECYLALKDYKAVTGRPVYAYFGSMAASGGYYLSMASDKIIANKNCWTGSIGVTLSTIYDITGLMDKYGVKATTIHAGKNKEMGAYTETLTDEQIAILQSLVDECYEDFVSIVAEGRGLSVKATKQLADGSIYTARQALEKKLIDAIGSYDEAVEMMKADFPDLANVKVEDIVHNTSSAALDDILGFFKSNVSREGELGQIRELMELNGTVKLSYISEIRK